MSWSLSKREAEECSNPDRTNPIEIVGSSRFSSINEHDYWIFCEVVALLPRFQNTWMSRFRECIRATTLVDCIPTGLGEF
jgi:hypothetical protein